MSFFMASAYGSIEMSCLLWSCWSDAGWSRPWVYVLGMQFWPHIPSFSCLKRCCNGEEDRAARSTVSPLYPCSYGPRGVSARWLPISMSGEPLLWGSFTSDTPTFLRRCWKSLLLKKNVSFPVLLFLRLPSPTSHFFLYIGHSPS